MDGCGLGKELLKGRGGGASSAFSKKFLIGCLGWEARCAIVSGEHLIIFLICRGLLVSMFQKQLS
jgi:hypothetical protein